MTNILKHKEKAPIFVLYLMIDGQAKLIKFWDETDPYTGTYSHGNWIPLEVQDRHIKLVDNFEEASKIEKLSTFSVWSRESKAKEKIDKLLNENNKTFADIKIIKIKYPTPIEEEVIIDWDLI